MHPLIYDVAVSADGFISGVNEDISRFAASGTLVEDYLDRLATYSIAVMGAATYRFGYSFGLKPGQNPYPHMRSVVFSSKLSVPDGAQIEVSRADPVATLPHLKAEATGPIYLCGGGLLAGSLLRAGLIDRLRLKRAAILLGDGVRLFEGIKQPPDLRLLNEKMHSNGAIFQDFEIV